MLAGVFELVAVQPQPADQENPHVVFRAFAAVGPAIFAGGAFRGQGLCCQGQEKQKPRLSGTQLKRFRLSRSLSQASMGALLEVTAQKYARWESGRSQMAPEVEARFAEIQKMKASELRTKLQELGFFQANGKKQKSKRRTKAKHRKRKSVNLSPGRSSPMRR